MATSLMADEEFKQWKRKRLITFVSFLIRSLFQGIAQSMVATSLQIFIKQEIVYSDEHLLYSIICGSYNLSPIIFNVFISKWSDRTRNTKALLSICTFLNLIGNVLYTFTFRPYLLVVGRFLQGTIQLTRPSTTAEIARSYPEDELHKKLPLAGLFGVIGFGIGPIIAAFFINQQLVIGTLHLKYGSLCGLFMTILTILQLIMNLFLTSNLSKDYDLKANTNYHEKNENEEQTQESKSVENTTDKQTLPNIFKKLLSNQDTCLLLIATFYTFFVTRLFFWSISELILVYMHSSADFISYYYTVHFILIFAMITAVTRIKMTNSGMFWFGLTTLISILLAVIFMYVIYNNNNLNVQIGFLILFCLCFAYQELGEKIFIAVSYAKMLDSQNLGTCEGIRHIVLRVSSMLGSSSAVYALEYYNYTSWVLFAATVLLMVWVISRKKSFFDPKRVV